MIAGASFGWQAKEQTENLSLPTQLRACEEYCCRQGYEILERFHEEGESANCRLNKAPIRTWTRRARTSARSGRQYNVMSFLTDGSNIGLEDL